MKSILIDEHKKWCKANLHCHTTNSDGFFASEQIKEMYQKDMKWGINL